MFDSVVVAVVIMRFRLLTGGLFYVSRVYVMCAYLQLPASFVVSVRRHGAHMAGVLRGEHVITRKVVFLVALGNMKISSIRNVCGASHTSASA